MLKRFLAAALCCGLLFSSALADGLDSLRAVADALQQAEGKGEAQCIVEIDADLYSQYTKEEWKDLIMQATNLVYSYGFTFTPGDASTRVRVRYTYRQGVQIVQAWQSGDLSGLTEDQRRALDMALEAARDIQAAASDPYDQALAAHDYLCAHIEYHSAADASEDIEIRRRRRSAVGALLDGKANCQGYADSYYLLCSLLGLDVYLQSNTEGSHVWNLMRFDGDEWCVVDLTYDDESYVFENNLSYRYFGAGCDLLGDHEWNEALAPRQLAQTSGTDYYYYRGWPYGQAFDSLGELAAYCWDMRSGGADIYAMLRNDTVDTDDINRAVKKAAGKTKCSWRFGWRTSGGHTFLCLRWTK